MDESPAKRGFCRFEVEYRKRGFRGFGQNSVLAGAEHAPPASRDHPTGAQAPGQRCRPSQQLQLRVVATSRGAGRSFITSARSPPHRPPRMLCLSVRCPGSDAPAGRVASVATRRRS
jgi:hypothetical protein